MIEITQELLARIAAEAEKSYPDECCGFIIGILPDLNDPMDKVAESIVPCENQFEEDEKFHRFLIRPEEMLKVQRSAARSGKDIIGFYHSHPDCRAIPSEYDRAHALPIYSYMITSAVKGKAVETLCWTLDENSHFQSEEINIEE